jgi:predicted GNAT family N-acyltransferase
LAEDGVEVRLAEGEAELEGAKELRLRVFSGEQGVPPEHELDGLDPGATHIVALRRGQVVGTCRLRFPRGRCKLERMVVDPSLQRTGVGRKLTAAAEREAARQGVEEIVLHAQRRIEDFYAACGYAPEGDTFLEEGIPHVRMRKRIGTAQQAEA